MKVKNDTAATKMTPEGAAQAIEEAQAALRDLQAEKATLPELFVEALKRGDAAGAQVARQRRNEIDLFIAVAEVAVIEAKLNQVQVALDMQRGDYEAKKAVATELREKCDRARTAGAQLIELEHLDIDARHAGNAAMKSHQHWIALNGTNVKLTAELDRKRAQLGALL